MANRHRKHGGRAGGGRSVYSGAASNVKEEADSTSESFKRGGHRKSGGKVHGGMPHGRLDKRARGGAVGHSPFSSASRMEDVKRTPKTVDKGMPRKDGGRTNPVSAKHPANFGAHGGAGHEEPREHHLPVHHGHGGTAHHTSEGHHAHGGAAGHGNSGHAPGGTHAGIHHPAHHKRGGEVMHAVGGSKRRKHGGKVEEDGG